MRGIFFVLLVFSALTAAGQTLPPIPERIVSLNCDNKRTDEVVRDIAKQGHFEVAWNSLLFDPAKPVTLHVQNITVRRAIYLVFGNTITFRVKGNYLILLAAPAPIAATTGPPKKKEFVVSGYTTDASGVAVAHVSVYDSISLASTLSDEYGHYAMKLDGSTQPVRIKVSRESYLDTFLVVTPSSNLSQDIILRPVPPPPPPAVIDTLRPTDTVIAVIEPPRTVEHYKFLDSLIGFEAVKQSQNLKEYFQRGGQVSLLPYVSTNGKLGGNVVNKFSLNVIAGYSGGTNGVELGGALNIDRKDVRWLQLAGCGNVVGGNLTGVQGAGAFNLNLGSVTGLQMSGGINILFDTLRGVQLAGGSNVIRGAVYGVQMAGGNNLVTRDMDGFQLAGGLNVTFGSVNKLQGAGGMNYAWSTRGAQLAGGTNVTLHELKGAQISAGLNYAGRVKGVQVAAGMNFTPDSLTGVQVAAGLNFAMHMNGTQFAVLNIARNVHGFQVGIVNIADTCSGGLIFGFMSIVPHGIHELNVAASEKGFVTLSLHTGIPKFYNIFSFGFDPAYPEHETWTFGYGVGHRFLVHPKLNLALDLTAHHVNNGRVSEYTNEWAQLAFTAEWRPTRLFAIAAGPVFHYYVTGGAEDELGLFHPKPLYENTYANGFRDMGWIGATVALRFF